MRYKWDIKDGLYVYMLHDGVEPYSGTTYMYLH